MSKRHFLGIAVVLGALAVPLNYNIIVNYEQVAATSATVDEQTAYQEAVARVREMQKLAEANPSVTYPGLATYLKNLADDVEEYGKYSNPSDVIAALNEAVEGVSYLLGVNRTATVAADNVSNARVAESANASSVRTVAAEPTQVAQTEIKLTVAAPETTADTKTAGDDYVADEKTDVVLAQAEVENQPEVPKTSAPESAKASYAGLIVAGVAVVLSTIVASVAIVAAKKKQ